MSEATIRRAVSLAVIAVVVGMAGVAMAGPGGGNPSDYFNWFDFTDYGKTPPMILMIVNFTIVVALGIKFAGPGIGRYLDKRHTRIKDALAEAAELRKQAQAKLEEYSSKIDDAEREVDELIEGIRADAEAERARIIADAEAQAAAMKKDAEDKISAELERAKAELEREVVAIAVAAAEKIIREQATTDDQNQLFRAFIADVGERAGAEEQV